MRMPCIVRGPGKIAPGVSDELCASLDLLPTFARLADAPLPPGRIIDGRDIWPLLAREPGAQSPYDERGFFYYRLEQLQAVRAGAWKLYLPLENKYLNLARKTAAAPLELYDVRNDPSEQHEASVEHPEIVKRLLALAEAAREDLGDVDRPGKNQRPAGHVAEPKPQVKSS
jgi:arylsulfatase A-like enzyme